jgi:hypothetical protein
LRALVVRWLSEEDNQHSDMEHSEAWAKAALEYIVAECQAGERTEISSLADQLRTFYDRKIQKLWTFREMDKDVDPPQQHSFNAALNECWLDWLRLTQAYYPDDYPGLMLRHADLGGTQLSLRQYHEAAQNLTMALEYEQKTNKTTSCGDDCLLKLIDLGQIMKDPAMSRNYEQILHQRAQISKPAMFKWDLANAQTLCRQGHAKEAIAIFDKHLRSMESISPAKLADQSHFHNHYMMCLLSAADIANQQQQFPESERLARKLLFDCSNLYGYNEYAPSAVGVAVQSLKHQQKPAVCRDLLLQLQNSTQRRVRATARDALAQLEKD